MRDLMTGTFSDHTVYVAAGAEKAASREVRR